MYELVINITSSMVVEICGVISKYVTFVDPNLIKTGIYINAKLKEVLMRGCN